MPTTPPQKSLRLLFYLPSLAGGGAERLLASLATEMVHRGHGVVFAVDTEAAENAGHLDPKVRIERLGANHAVATLRLARLLRQHRPDVSLSALGGQNLKHLLAALIAGRGRHAIQSWHGFAEGEPKRLSRLSFGLIAVSSRLMARTIAVSEALRRNLLTRFRASAAKTICIRNGVALAPWSDLRDAETPPVILACGRLSPDKNYPLLLRAFAGMTDKEARLVILGEGPERASLETEIVRLGIASRVGMPGFTDPGPYYKQASCFAITSDQEAFGLVVVEALAAGLPVVTTDSGGPPEILGTLGRVVKGTDPIPFAAAIDAALQSPGDRETLRNRAEDFTLARCADAYEALFVDIAQRSG